MNILYNFGIYTYKQLVNIASFRNLKARKMKQGHKEIFHYLAQNADPEGGYIWIGYGAIITVLPLLIVGFIGRYVFKLNYYTLIGVLSGATTNPPALAYSNDLTSCDAPAVGYATVYPLTMFLRVLTAQLLILSLG